MSALFGRFHLAYYGIIVLKTQEEPSAAGIRADANVIENTPGL